jgi:hypothetical protein
MLHGIIFYKRSSSKFFSRCPSGSLKTDSVVLQFEVLFVNPNGEQLSTEFLPLPYLYMVAGGLWLIASIFWLSNWMIYKRVSAILISTIFILYIERNSYFLVRFYEFLRCGSDR